MSPKALFGCDCHISLCLVFMTVLKDGQVFYRLSLWWGLSDDFLRVSPFVLSER